MQVDVLRLAATCLHLLLEEYKDLSESLCRPLDDELVLQSEAVLRTLIQPVTAEELAGLCGFANDIQRKAGVHRASRLN